MNASSTQRTRGATLPIMPPLLKEDTRQTTRDIRAAIIFGVIAASIEMAVLVYFFR